MPKQKQFLKSHRKSAKPKDTRARLQYELAQQPRLLQHLPGDLIDLLKTALDSHKYALELNQENADLLFNTGQVLTSLAELISEARYQSEDAAGTDPLHLFQEALEFFQRCLSLQEYQLTQVEADVNAPARESMELDKQSVGTTKGNESGSRQPSEEPSDEDTWAAIIEPVTYGTLLDTLLAQVETLTSICGLFSARGVGDPSWVEQYYQNILQERIVLAAREVEREHEAALVQAKFKCGLADAGFTTSRLSLPTYEREIALAYENFKTSGDNPQALCDRADAEIIFNANIQRSLEQENGIMPEDNAKLNVLRWKHLTKALDNFTAASKLPNARNLPRIHLRRGDCEMLRRRLGEDPSNYEIASKSEPTLLKNAEIYYRGAARLAKAEAAIDEEGETLAKEAIVGILSGDHSKLSAKTATDTHKVQEVVEDMIDEGLLLRHDLEKLSIKGL
ncbi:MAG: hypothetical protein Q9225_005096 [Loekoesia sp. 1 TL-2023]